MLTAVRWMTPWEVTGQPMKPTNCSSGQFSATARTDRSVTWRKKTSDDYLFLNDIQFQLKKSMCPLSPFIYSAMFIGSRWLWSNSWLENLEMPLHEHHLYPSNRPWRRLGIGLRSELDLRTGDCCLNAFSFPFLKFHNKLIFVFIRGIKNVIRKRLKFQLPNEKQPNTKCTSKTITTGRKYFLFR